MQIVFTRSNIDYARGCSYEDLRFPLLAKYSSTGIWDTRLGIAKNDKVLRTTTRVLAKQNEFSEADLISLKG